MRRTGRNMQRKIENTIIIVLIAVALFSIITIISSIISRKNNETVNADDIVTKAVETNLSMMTVSVLINKVLLLPVIAASTDTIADVPAETVSMDILAVEDTTADTSAAESTTADTSAVESTTADTPAAESTTADTPAVEDTTADTPAAESTTADTPAVESTTADTVPVEGKDENTKVMYLTFDDGPSLKNTPVILDILKERNVKATFFVVGECAERHPELVRRIVEEGHAIGLHSYNHKFDEIYASPENFVRDLEKVDKAVFDAVGIHSKLYRFPGGSVNSYNKNTYHAVVKELTDREYVYFDWNASVEDAVKNPVASVILEKAKSTAARKSRVIMLAHDRVQQTGEALNGIIDLFIDEYRMEILTTDTIPVQFSFR